MKNFIISNIKQLRKEGTDEAFTIDPFIKYLMERDNEIINYKSVESAEFITSTRKTMDEAVEFVEAKYQKYIPILAKRLNQIHGTSHSEFFWKKSLSFDFIRYLTMFHDVFAKCEKYFNPQEHTCKILSKKSYHIPLDFDDHRNTFESTLYGQEQVFSLYVSLFCPNQFETINLEPEKHLFKVDFCQKTLKAQFKVLRRKILAVFLKKYKEKLDRLNHREKVTVGILGSFFNPSYIQQLINESDEKIEPIEIDYSKQKIKDNRVDYKKRYILGEFEEDFDRFDKFFFSSLIYCLPKAYVENFKKLYKIDIDLIKKYPNLKYVTSEAWLSDTYISILLAAMRENEIKHIYNEHNCIFYPFTGTMIEDIADLVDYYVSFGWENDKITNFVSKASLFPFTIDKSYEKKYKLLYVCYAAMYKMSIYGGNYGISDSNAVKNLNFTKTFMKNLDLKVLKEMAYRGYPKDYSIKFLAYDKEEYLKEYLKHVYMTQANYAENETCKEQMLKSRLVIVDYVSTAYLEALMMNIPVVFFFDPNANYLKEDFKDFYKPLIDVGICQTDPVKAAKFIEQIVDNPEQWWTSERVQKGKNEFLNKNFKAPQVMIDYLLNLAES